ncbi:unnamed protein product [marine sediment metagenome]|uniref:Glycosyltransferase 2-like domain-containing protein n=1 Tax=marine sediment metagenome TaxID=412755 RepID=X0VZG5_9ZZZZ
MISIITRCRNRLEYTTQVLDAVKQNTKCDYEHIIVDNDSSDGTKEWFAWMAKNTDWYNKVKYHRMERNCGDWGGMLYGATVANNATVGNYIVQLDNDIIPCEGWLTAMLTVLQNKSYRVVMLKRDNVAWKLKSLSVPVSTGGVVTTRVERAVACYMMSKEDFDLCSKYIPEAQGAKSKYIMAGLTRRWKGLTIGKILNKTCYELQADAGNDIQREKYSPKNPQIWEKI